MLKSAFGRLSTGVCRQPQCVYVGVFMYSLAGWSFVLPADYAPACADSRSGFMSGCLCIHWPDGALPFLRIMLRRVQTAAVGLCRGVYVFVGRVAPVLRSEIYHIIHAEMLSRQFMDFSAGCFSLSRTHMQCKFKLDEFRP